MNLLNDLKEELIHRQANGLDCAKLYEIIEYIIKLESYQDTLLEMLSIKDMELNEKEISNQSTVVQMANCLLKIKQLEDDIIFLLDLVTIPAIASDPTSKEHRLIQLADKYKID